MKNVNQDSKNKIKSIILLTLAFLLVAIVGATFAYFRAQVGEGANVNINASSGTTDSLMFTKGKDINITASQDDFKEGGDNKDDSSTLTATLIPNNKTNEAHRKYNVYFVIDNNDFIYTTETEEPEIILQVINPKNEPVTTIPGLNYVTVEQDGETIEGFDITIRKGHAFEIAKDYAIDATNGKVDQEWQIKVILINLKTNQNENGGKTFHGSVQITTDTKETYTLAENNTMTAPSKSYNSITVESTVIPGTIPIDKYYFAIEETTETETIGIMSIVEKLSLTYHESPTNTYTFEETEDGKGLKENQAYKIYSYAIDEEGIQSNIHSEVIKTDKYKQVEVTGEVSDITSTSMKLTLTANDETSDGKVDKYYFRKDEEENWVESETNSYVFQGLEPGHDYTLYGKVVDTNGRDSNIWEDPETTLNLYTVSVEVTNGNSEPREQNVDEGQDATFTITVDEGYDLSDAKVIEGNCTLGNVNGSSRTLTASNVISDINCKVDIPKTVILKNYIVTQVGQVVGGELIKHDGSHIATENTENGAQTGDVLDANDDGYRYSGNNPNNFICFGPGSEDYNDGEGTCPLRNQYRIIGLVPVQVSQVGDGESQIQTLVKVIKSEYITASELGEEKADSESLSVNDSYAKNPRIETQVGIHGFYWGSNDSNEWLSGKLNSILNDNKKGYLSKLNNSSDGIDWTEKIETVKWNVGGLPHISITPSKMKKLEESMETEGEGGKVTSTAKIGLIYNYDYGFASSKENWGKILFYYKENDTTYNGDSNRNNNWLFNGVDEWTITRSSFSLNVFNVGNRGCISNIVGNNSYAVRPVFYLKSDVKIKSDGADGSSNSPFRIFY